MSANKSPSQDPVQQSLVIGKFWPPHLGHHQMIEDVALGFDGVRHKQYIVVCVATGQRPSGRERARWLQAVHPAAEVIVVDDLCADHFPAYCRPECTPRWVERITSLGLGHLHIVGTNEEYGPGFAQGLGADHVFTDQSRSIHTVSATEIRHDLKSMWPNLHPVVRAGLYRRIAVVGAESTGTSTLSRDLSRALRAPLAAEAGRMVSWELYAAAGDMDEVSWKSGDFWSIIDQQIRLEHDAIWTDVLRNGSWNTEFGPVLICDTDTLATVAWWERYLETDPTAPADLASQRLADIYIVTSPDDVTFDDSDPTRDGRAIRLAMHDRFLDLAASSGRPWIEVNGSPEERLEQALAFLVTASRENPIFVHHSNNQ